MRTRGGGLTEEAWLRRVFEDLIGEAFTPADDPGAVGRCGVEQAVRFVLERREETMRHIDFVVNEQWFTIYAIYTSHVANFGSWFHLGAVISRTPLRQLKLRDLCALLSIESAASARMAWLSHAKFY